jgi:hypothetical protein
LPAFPLESPFILPAQFLGRVRESGGSNFNDNYPFRWVNFARQSTITPLDAPQEFLSEATREREARSAAQDTALMRALGLAHHWQRLLDEQRAASVAEIAEAEGMDVTQVRRVMRLTLLAPEVVERLVGSPDAVLEKVMRRPWPNAWGDQMRVLASPG